MFEGPIYISDRVVSLVRSLLKSGSSLEVFFLQEGCFVGCVNHSRASWLSRGKKYLPGRSIWQENAAPIKFLAWK